MLKFQKDFKCKKQIKIKMHTLKLKQKKGVGTALIVSIGVERKDYLMRSGGLV